MMTYGHSTGKPRSDAENELIIAKEFENMSVRTGEDGSDTEYSRSMRSGTYKTFQTFASDWSQCSNISFGKYVIYFMFIYLLATPKFFSNRRKVQNILLF